MRKEPGGSLYSGPFMLKISSHQKSKKIFSEFDALLIALDQLGIFSYGSTQNPSSSGNVADAALLFSESIPQIVEM